MLDWDLHILQIGVTTGYLTKLITGKNTLDQYQAAPLPVILTFILFIAVRLCLAPLTVNSVCYLIITHVMSTACYCHISSQVTKASVLSDVFPLWVQASNTYLTDSTRCFLSVKLWSLHRTKSHTCAP